MTARAKDFETSFVEKSSVVVVVIIVGVVTRQVCNFLNVINYEAEREMDQSFERSENFK